MNIPSSLSILLSLLFLSAIQCYHLDGNTMYDLEYQGLAFDTEAASWTTTNPLVTVGVKTTQCGLNRWLGGYKILSGAPPYAVYWSRDYSGLPSHNKITLQMKLYMIDSWDPNSSSYSFGLLFDGFGYGIIETSSSYTNYVKADECGNPSYQDLDPMILHVTWSHTATTLNLQTYNYFVKTSDLQSFGFRDIIMTFSTESSVSYTRCAVTSGYPLTGLLPACSCGADTSMTFPNSGLCSVCDPSCLTCNGAGPSMCTSCVAGEYLRNGSCNRCDSSCRTCNGAGPSVCTTCLAGKYFKSGSCYCDSPCQTCDGAGPSLCSSCLAGRYLKSNSCSLCDSSCLTCNGAGPSLCSSCLAGRYLDGNSCYLCVSPCKTCNGTGSAACTSCEVGQFLSNGSCYASCEDPLGKISSGGVDYCTTPCPGQFLFLTGECSSLCESPRIQTTMNGFAVCISPCKDSEYFDDSEKKCYPTCESPYKIEVIDEIKFCKVEGSLSHDEVEDIKKAADSIQTTGKATSAGMKAASIINSNSPNSALLAGLSSMMQYIRYMKINFPPKVQVLFKVSAGNPISSSFGVGIPSIVKENLSDDPLPYAFDKYDINSNFVSNLWDFMVSLILMLLAILMLTVLKLITSGHRRINLVVRKILQALKWNFPIMMVCGSSGEIVFFASLQLRSSPFTGLSSTICCIVSILMMVLVIFLLTMAFKIARTVRKEGLQNLAQQKPGKIAKWKGYEILYVEYEDNSFYSLAYMFLFLSRNIIFNLTLATLFEYPLIECCIINACNFMMVCYLIYLRPLKDLFALVQLWINEGLLNVLSICVLILGILDYLEVEQQTTRNGMQDAILIAIKTFNFAALAFTGIGFLIFMRSACRIWKTGRAKGMRSPLQMFNFLFFGDGDEEVIDKQSKKNLQIDKDFRENNTSTIELKGDISVICDTTVMNDPSTKILQNREQAPDFEMNPQLFFKPQKDLTEGRKRKVKVKRRSNILGNATGEIDDSNSKNNDAENELWFLKFRKLKSRLNWNAQKTDLTIETNITSFQ